MLVAGRVLCGMSLDDLEHSVNFGPASKTFGHGCVGGVLCEMKLRVRRYMTMYFRARSFVLYAPSGFLLWP